MKYGFLRSILGRCGYLFVGSLLVIHSAHAATDPPTVRSGRTTSPRPRPRPRPSVRLPPIPMLRSRLPKSRTLPIFRSNTLQRVIREHSGRSHAEPELTLPTSGQRKRLPTRHPQRDQRLHTELAPQPRFQSPLIRSRHRLGVRIPGHATLAQDIHVRYLVRLRNLGRKGIWRRWTGQIVIRHGKLQFFCPLRSFCKTLQQQTQTLLRQPQFLRKKLPQSQWLWHLRRGLEKQFNYTVVALPL